MQGNSRSPAPEGMLLERDAELEQLHRLLADLESSGGRVVLVRGEAGVGKTVLVSRFLDEVEGRAHVLLGVCDDLLTPQPLGPVWDVARHEPSLSVPLAGGDRRGVMEALLALLSRRLRPTILVFEDLQWSDEATLDVTRFLGRRIASTRGLLILTYRDGEVDTSHPFRLVIGELHPQDLVRMNLKGLSAEGVQAVVTGRDVDVDQVMVLTGGNPLFVSEVAAWGVDEVPASVRDAVLTRAAKLSARARRVLDLVSVIPGEADRDVIARILDAGSEPIVECERRGLLRAEGATISFRHELARRAVESALSDTDRRRLNQQVLDAIHAYSDPARAVHHAREAGDEEAIIAFAPRAARMAMAVEGHREARDHFRALEPYLDRVNERDRAAILEDWARTEMLFDDKAALTILARAIGLYRDAGSDRELARALTLAVRLHERCGDPQAAEACSQEAIAILQAHPPDAGLAYALSQRAWLAMILDPRGRAVELADQAISIAEAAGDQLALTHALNTKGSGMCLGGDPAGFGVLEECQRRAEQHGYPFEEVRALSNIAECAAEILELDWAGDLAQRARDTAARHEMPAMEAHVRAQLAGILLLRGEWAAAEDTLTDLLASSPYAETAVVFALGTLQARSGRAEARATLERGWSLAQIHAEPQLLAAAATGMAEYLWLNGEDDRDLIARFHGILDAAVPTGWTLTGGALAFWLWKLEQPTIAPDWIAVPYRLLMSGRPVEAAALWEQRGMPYERALALMHGDGDEPLRALRILERLGASAAAGRLRRLLADRGMRIPRGPAAATREHPVGLTARQAEVLDLLVAGLTTPQVADRLFISPRTAESHVAAIFTKLGVTDRHDAVEAAHQLGLLTSS